MEQAYGSQDGCSKLHIAVEAELRLHSDSCSTRAEAFSTGGNWRRAAELALRTWADHSRQSVGLYGRLFLAEANGNWWHWLEVDAATGIKIGSAPEILPELPVTANEVLTPNSIGIQPSLCPYHAAPVYSCDNRLAFWLGFAAGDQRYDGEALLKSFRKQAAAFVPYLYLQVEKDTNSRLSELHELGEKEARKRELLFQMAQELYSKIDTDAILADILGRIKELYPQAQMDLLMTQDHPDSAIPVKPLRFMSAENDACTRAYMEGHIVIDKGSRNGDYEMAVPISGKQGIYGVLHLHSHQGPFESSDIGLMKILSGAAGSAFENAKLYEQSNLLVNELRLINELTKRLNQSLKLNEIFNFASSELLRIFRADYCCVLQLDKERNELVVQASNLPAMLQDNFRTDYGFSGVICSSKEPVILSDYMANPAIPSKLMELTGSRSLIASPILVHSEVHGVILLAHRYPNHFSYDNFKLLQVLAGHIGLAMANASLHAEVRRMAITDNLTGLYARHYLDEQVSILQKKDFCGSLIVVDIDNFKGVNDTFGHQVGDQILHQVSRIIQTSIRERDIAARWGGEELAVYLPQVTTEQAVRIAERIRKKVAEETEPKVTVSCGISEWNWQDEKISVEALFYRSDMALYRAKHEGKNQIRTG